MKKIIGVSAAILMLASPAYAEDIKIGISLGFTGPLESLAPAMYNGAQMAIDEVNESKALLEGSSVTSVRGDSTCADMAAAVATGERLITSEKVNAIVGPMCSGASAAVLEGVAIPNGVVMISPSATGANLSIVEDNGLFFRTAPSDARSAEVLADILHEKGYKSIAITYVNNDYGKGLAAGIETNFIAGGGSVSINVGHEESKADYSSDVAALAQAGGDILVVAGYADGGGSAIIRGSLDAGSFENFFLPDGMYAPSLTETFGNEINGAIGASAGTDSPGNATFKEMFAEAGFEFSVYADTAYDAAALIMLSMQSANSSSSSDLKEHVFDVANEPGEKIYPGEIEKGLKILADGGEINYEGGSAVNLIAPGESSGAFQQYEVINGQFETVGYR
jgi:branched-chain amino acid transport system substrate-binding protein